MQRLDEGIDLPNIYTMAVVNDTETNFKTSVKQIIGRGVRLNKDVREFDGEPDPLTQQAEKLHIVCDQGKNFEEVIEAIQQEFGLNDKYLSLDKPRLPVINHVKADLLRGMYIPHIRADVKAKEGVSLLDLVRDHTTVVDRYMEENCFTGIEDVERRFVKYRPESFFLEVDIFADQKEYHRQLQQAGGEVADLRITEKELKAIYSHVQKNLHCLPDSETVRKAFRAYIDLFNEKGLHYYRVDTADDKLALNLFVNSFSFFYRNHIEKNYFRLDFSRTNEGESWNLMKRFEDYEIRIPGDQVKNRSRSRVTDRSKLIDLIEAGYQFYGYGQSVYEYEKFESYPEKQLAEYLDAVLGAEAVGKEAGAEGREGKKTGGEGKRADGVGAGKQAGAEGRAGNFWIRNQRNIWFTYGSKRYYPDFILFKDDLIYIIETKAEKFSDTKKNTLLRKLDETPGDGAIKGYRGVLVFSPQLDKLEEPLIGFEDFVLESEEILQRHQSKETLIQDPPAADRFVRYLPVYSPLKAFKHFVKQQRSPQSDGWLEVPLIESGYPETAFATQAKGNALLPKYQHNDWILLQYTPNVAEAVGKLALVFSEGITDAYDPGCVIRQVEIVEKVVRTSLFPEKEIRLRALDKNGEDIVVKDVGVGEVEVVGVEIELIDQSG